MKLKNGVASDGRFTREKQKADHPGVELPNVSLHFVSPTDCISRMQSRGAACPANGDNDSAIADYSEAIRLDPKDTDAYKNRGDAYQNKGDYDRAIADYSEAIRLDPKYAGAYNNRGDAYRDKGDNDRAIADYNEAIRIDPKYANAYNSRGAAYRAKGDNDRAIADYRRGNTARSQRRHRIRHPVGHAYRL